MEEPKQLPLRLKAKLFYGGSKLADMMEKMKQMYFLKYFEKVKEKQKDKSVEKSALLF